MRAYYGGLTAEPWRIAAQPAVINELISKSFFERMRKSYTPISLEQSAFPKTPVRVRSQCARSVRQPAPPWPGPWHVTATLKMDFIAAVPFNCRRSVQ